MFISSSITSVRPLASGATMLEAGTIRAAHRNRHLRPLRLSSATAIITLLLSTPGFARTAASSAVAQTPNPAANAAATDPSGPGLQDIVVTAEKRAGSLQRTPISITALGGKDLATAQVRALTDIQTLVPGFQIGSSIGVAQLNIRGIGISTVIAPSSESAVAVNLNDVYVSRTISQLAGFYDIASVEVLRGPQGTLYGRNATAGSVNIRTNMPTSELSGFGRIAVGNYNSLNVEGAVSGPLAGDKLTVRIAGMIDDHSGYGKNIVSGNQIDDHHARAVRATLVAKPVSWLKATLIGEYFHERDNGAALHYFGASQLTGLPGTTGQLPTSIVRGGIEPDNIRDIARGIDPRFRLSTVGVTGILEGYLGPLTLKSITGYRYQNAYVRTDLDGSSVLGGFYELSEKAHQTSEELQANYSNSRLTATVGLYYFNELDTGDPSDVVATGGFLGLPGDLYDFVVTRSTTRTIAKAAFGQATYKLTDALSVTAGLRYSEEKKTLDQRLAVGFPPYLGTGKNPDPASVFFPAKFHSLTPKFGVQYQLDRKTLLYATYSKGFKSGGFDPTAPGQAYQPEKLTDYEGGIKTTFLDNKIRANVGGFYYDYTNLQVNQVIGTSSITTNAGTARIYGAEAELSAVPTDALKLDVSLSYLHARYEKYIGIETAQPLLVNVDFRGNRLGNAPTWKIHAGAEYDIAMANGKLAPRLELDYSSKFYFDPGNLDILSQGKFTKLNAFLTYNSDARWHVMAFIKNITNKTTKTSAFVAAPAFQYPILGGLAPPRTFGMEFEYNF